MTPASFWFVVPRPLIRRIGEPDCTRVTDASCQPSASFRTTAFPLELMKRRPRPIGISYSQFSLTACRISNGDGDLSYPTLCNVVKLAPIPWLCSLEIE